MGKLKTRSFAMPVLGLLVALACCWSSAFASEIPREAKVHQRLLVRTANYSWGLDAPVALFAAQVHQESRWRFDARSPAGAEGLAQFMPRTAIWMTEVNRDLVPAQPFNPAWALRAMVLYDAWLFKRVDASSPCERWAFTLSAYNGGLAWVKRDQQVAAAAGADPSIWFEQVEQFNAGRSKAAFKENRHYPTVIIKRWQSLYASNSWGLGVCYAF
jgi:soluble lytic murein transglycosylase-like protein